MEKIIELELHSLPGLLLSQDFGKDVRELVVDELELPEEVFLGLSYIPSKTHAANLKTNIERGEILEIDYYRFCKSNNLATEIGNIISAASFLEYQYGRGIAWLHLPYNDSGVKYFRKIVQWAKKNNYCIQDGNNTWCLNFDADINDLVDLVYYGK